jgi:hypothetical protein
VISDKKGATVFSCIVGFLLAFELAAILLYAFNILSAYFLSIECLVINFVAATYVLVTLFVIHLKFSGSPYKSMIHQNCAQKLSHGVVVWSLSRYLRGLWGIFEDQYFHGIFVGLTFEKSENLLVPMLTVGLYIIVEVLPFLFVLDWTFMEIFTFMTPEQASSNSSSQLQTKPDRNIGLQDFSIQNSVSKSTL